MPDVQETARVRHEQPLASVLLGTVQTHRSGGMGERRLRDSRRAGIGRSGLDRRAARKDAKRAGRKRTQEEVENLLGISSKNSTDRTRKCNGPCCFYLLQIRRQARLRPSSSKTCEGLSLFLQGLPACRCCRLGRRRLQCACRGKSVSQ